MNITLIGMAGSGKSAVGRALAKRLKYGFVDTDDLIELKSGMQLQQILDTLGRDEFIKTEELAILELCKYGMGTDNRNYHVIATGGSVIYSEKAMDFLKRNSIVVFLNAPLSILKKRLRNMDSRGIVGLKDKGLDELFNERLALYKKYSDITIGLYEEGRIGNTVDSIFERIQHEPSKAAIRIIGNNQK